MRELHSANIFCPYCGEQIDVLVDGSLIRQEYIEDCSVCCRPIVLAVVATDGGIESIVGKREDD